MQGIYNLTTLTNMKKELNKDNATNDDYLEQLIMLCSEDIENYTERKLRARTYGANGISEDYYDGSGKRRLYTNQYPIISITSIHDDTLRDFGSDTLKDSSDYYVEDYDAGLISLEEDAVLGTAFSKGRGNIKLIYEAGFDHFYVIDDQNDRLDFYEDGGSSEKTANLTGSVYTGSSLATQIKTAMDAAGANTYTVTYDSFTGLFKIATSGTDLTLRTENGTNAYRTAARTIGFDGFSDSSTAASVTSDFSVLGIPGTLERACIELCLRRWFESKHGMNRFDIDSMRFVEPSAGTKKYVGGELPPDVKRLLRPFKRIALT